jgi:hypothetical protein
VTPQGTRWEIDANELTRTGERTGEPIGRERTNEPTNETRESRSFGTQSQANRRTERPEPDANERTEREAEWKAEVQFLRGVVEAQSRDAAELRAALREALKMSARQLPEPGQSREDAPERTQSPAGASQSPQTMKAPQIEAQRQSEGRKTFRRWLLELLRG